MFVSRPTTNVSVCSGFNNEVSTFLMSFCTLFTIRQHAGFFIGFVWTKVKSLGIRSPSRSRSILNYNTLYRPAALSHSLALPSYRFWNASSLHIRQVQTAESLSSVFCTPFPVECHDFDVRRSVTTRCNFTLTMSTLSGVALILVTKYLVLMVLGCTRQRECDWAWVCIISNIVIGLSPPSVNVLLIVCDRWCMFTEWTGT